MVPTRIEVTDDPKPIDRLVILAGLVSFNERMAGLVGRPLAVIVRDLAGTAVGGLIGRTIGSWLYVELLWIPGDLRGRGLGAEVVERAEEEARSRGCIGVHLDTYSFQAPEFYVRLGYEVFGVIEDHPPGERRLFLRKRF